ncbi:hypothetical protein ACS0TY_028002 [Phlomoides rotata]
MENSDVTLRPLKITDVNAAVKWYTDEKMSRFCTWDTFTTEEDAITYFLQNDYNHPWCKAICVSGRAVGLISVDPFHGDDRCRAELGYEVSSEYWGRGVATQAVKLAAAAVFAEWDHLERLEAAVDVENPASQRVVEKAGFMKEGVLRKYYLLKGKPRDAVMFSLLRSDITSS